ncbi:hypothetical protein FJW10_06315 [Mesorhizobium sp. B4-1-1]|nr:hypothetical protein FJW10_06315 [Mesorhizobium sp. B4-1-1]
MLTAGPDVHRFLLKEYPLPSFCCGMSATPFGSLIRCRGRGSGHAGGRQAARRATDLRQTRRRDPTPAVTILIPDAPRLQHEPQADCARYDSPGRAS